MSITLEISKNLTTDQTLQIDRLWNELYPIKLNNRFKTLLDSTKQQDHLLLLDENDEIIGWAVAFLRDNETWFSILVSDHNQNKGYGKMLIETLKQNYSNLCGWVIDHNNDLKADGSHYFTPMEFYIKHGFVVRQERFETDLISAAKIYFER